VTRGGTPRCACYAIVLTFLLNRRVFIWRRAQAMLPTAEDLVPGLGRGCHPQPLRLPAHLGILALNSIACWHEASLCTAAPGMAQTTATVPCPGRREEGKNLFNTLHAPGLLLHSTGTHYYPTASHYHSPGQQDSISSHWADSPRLLLCHMGCVPGFALCAFSTTYLHRSLLLNCNSRLPAVVGRDFSNACQWRCAAGDCGSGILDRDCVPSG